MPPIPPSASPSAQRVSTLARAHAAKSMGLRYSRTTLRTGTLAPARKPGANSTMPSRNAARVYARHLTGGIMYYPTTPLVEYLHNRAITSLLPARHHTAAIHRACRALYTVINGFLRGPINISVTIVIICVRGHTAACALLAGPEGAASITTITPKTTLASDSSMLTAEGPSPTSDSCSASRRRRGTHS